MESCNNCVYHLIGYCEKFDIDTEERLSLDCFKVLDGCCYYCGKELSVSYEIHEVFGFKEKIKKLYCTECN